MCEIWPGLTRERSGRTLLSKVPNSIRAHHELAYQYYEKSGQYDAALALYHRGLQLQGQNIYEKALSLNNIASIHFTKGEYELAEIFWEKAIASFPQYQNAYYRLSLTQTKLGKWRTAAKTLAITDQKKTADAAILCVCGKLSHFTSMI